MLSPPSRQGSELYVSSMTQVLLYQYNAATRTVPTTFTVIVDHLPSDGGKYCHRIQSGSEQWSLMRFSWKELPAHTLLITPARGAVPRSLLVSNGPLDNIDATATDPSNGRSQIRRFALPPGARSTPYTWPSGGELIAYGIRNPAGFSLGPKLTQGILPPTLWAIENGASL